MYSPNSKKNAPIKYPNIPPITEKTVVIRKILMKSFFFDITIGITITSGGIGKNELSTNETTAK